MPRFTLPADRQPVIIAARRSAIGRARGMFTSLDVEDLAAPVMQAAISDANIAPTQIDEVILGNAAGPGGNVARLAALHAGLPAAIPAVTVDRQCGSGLEAIWQACLRIASGSATCILAGGVESQSRAPLRTLPASGDLAEHRYVRARFAPEAIGDPDMGEAAENVAETYGISRARQDAFAERSQSRAAAAQTAGAFSAEIVAIAGQSQDECIRAGMTVARLARLRPAFRKGGTVTVGNACPLNDGACVVIVTSAARAKSFGHTTALAFLDATAAGVDPNLLGIGPVVSTQKLLTRNPDLSIDALTHLEFNEAFASQTLACLDALGIPETLPNPQGGAIALGHPFGASGAILVTRLFSQLIRTPAPQDALAMAMIGIGGGQGITAAFSPTSL
ncbi:putative acetyl-CoA acyltransferase [Shimia sp. SK013]|uniref:thiolase family protein n=1 Tax=Shimia sp. SK013 TaxID=1389006 RepID=UPI0006CD76F4|nr:thiolase family protein [Shimia sp. SK013]KPA23604.1 putative acetyl-CoA acyltransferase [Shimia sp. SK013]